MSYINEAQQDAMAINKTQKKVKEIKHPNAVKVDFPQKSTLTEDGEEGVGLPRLNFKKLMGCGA